MLYLDTSVMVAVHTNEPHTDRVLSSLRRWSLEEEFAISEWTATEFASAPSLKVRTRQIGLEERNKATVAFGEMVTESLFVLGIDISHFRIAAIMAGQYATGLRAGDALHLAIAQSSGVALCTLDHGMAKAGAALGVSAKLI
jgi:predicted nucleic acid-binding protein